MGKLKKYRNLFLFAMVVVLTASFLLLNSSLRERISTINLFAGISHQDEKSSEKITGRKSESSVLNEDKAAKVYSLENDLKYEKSLLSRQQEKLTGKVDLRETGRNLNSNYYRIRVQAIEILGYFPGNEFIPVIENLLLNDSSAEARCQSAKSLRMLESKASVPQLIQALNDRDTNVKIFSALGLACLGEKEKCSEAVNKLWNNGNKNAPLYSCHQIFLYLNTPDAVDKLKFDLKNSDGYIAIDAAIILAQLGHSTEPFPFLENSLKDKNASIRRAAMRGLAYLGDQRSLNLIKSMKNDEDNLVRERATSILKNFDNNPFSRL
jgi:HEAT repeat protein